MFSGIELQQTNVLMSMGWQLLKKVKLCLSVDPVILLPGIYPRNMQAYVHMKTYIQVFTAAIWNSWKLETSQCSSTDGWINKLWYIYTTGYYLRIKRNTLWTRTMTFMNLIIIILSESDKPKNIYAVLLHLYESIGNVNWIILVIWRGKKEEIKMRHEETLRTDEFVYYIVCSDGCRNEYIHQNLSNCAH